MSAETVQIRRLARLGSGHTPSRQVPEYWDDCVIPWLTLADVGQLRDGSRRVVTETREKISALGLANSAAELHPRGTVAFSRTASVGFSCILGCDMATSQDFVTWTCGPELEPRFLLWCLRGRRQEILRRMQGSTHKTIYMPDIEQLRVPIRSRASQIAIADFLDAETERIDALIAKKRRMIELLTQRLDSAISDALARHGRIPLKRRVDYKEGPGIMAEDFREEGVPLLRVSGVGGQEASLVGCNHLDPAKVREKWERFRLVDGDYVISASASMGIASRVGVEAAGAVPYTGIIRFRPAGPQTDMEYVRFFLMSSDFVQQIDSLKTGVAIQHFGPTHLDQVSIPMPPLRDQRRIATRLGKLRTRTDETKFKFNRQIDLLAEHRQALITAAVTGQMEIPGVAA